ncbi:MAG: hypothetical protein ACI8W8_001820 [Rhodothermales bacterium]|jgi:hypothetical protein
MRYAPILLCLFLAGCPKPAPPAESVAPPVPPATHLGSAGEAKVTEADFRHRWSNRRRNDSPETRAALLDELLDRAVLVQRAREAGLEDDPVVREGIESLLISRYKELHLQPRIAGIDVSESDIQAYYDANRETRYAVPERIRVAVLWFDTRGAAERVARYAPRLQAARQKAAEVPADKGFGQLAIENSERQASRYRGGIEDWLEASANYDPWRQAVVEVAAGLKEPGELSTVVDRAEGSFLVRLLDRRAASFRSLDHAKEGILRELRNARRKQVQDEFVEAQRAVMKIERFPERLQALQSLPSAEKEPEVKPGPPAMPRR